MAFQTMPRLRADGTQPSTSRDSSKIESPHSPMERIAKRNALLMSEIDSRGKRLYFCNVMGTIPEFPLVDLNVKCNAISHILDYDAGALTTEVLAPLQKQLEDLIAENADHEKRLSGEIAFLNTGDYPTDDLRDRLLPVYTLRQKDDKDSTIPENFIESLVDMGLNSSPEEDIKNPTITDVPRRFWNWTREYLGHITEQDIIDLKTKLVDRFRDESLKVYLQDAVSSKNKSASKKPTKRRASQDNPVPAKLRPSDVPTTKYDNMLSQAFDYMTQEADHIKLKYVNSTQNSVDDASCDNVHATTNNNNNGKSHESNGFTTSVRRSSLRQEAGHENGHVPQHNGQLRNGSSPTLNGLKKSMMMADAVNATTNGDGLSQEVVALENGVEPDDPHLFSGDDRDENLDEISREIRKKQRELLQLSTATRPLIDRVFERMEAEYALYEVSRRLDLTEDKLFELGKKYDGIKSFTKEQRRECVNALADRHAMIQQAYRHNFQKEAADSPSRSSPASRKVSFSTKHSIINDSILLSNSLSEMLDVL